VRILLVIRAVVQIQVKSFEPRILPYSFLNVVAVVQVPYTTICGQLDLGFISLL
jgi:hypothetical protein